MNIKLLQYQSSNEKYLWNTYVSLMKPHITKIWGWDEKWQRRDFSQGLLEFDTFIIRFDKSDIGYIQTKQIKDHVFIRMLLLNVDYQNKGLGKIVLNEIRDFYGIDLLELKCFTVNKRAYQFYRKVGFNLLNEDEQFYTLRKLYT